MVGLVACDLIELPREVVDKSKSLVEKRTGIPPEHLIVSATHAHTGPKRQPSYDNWLAEKIADAVQMAAADFKPAEVAFGTGEERRLAFHRRYWMKDGTLRTNPGKLNPDVVRPAGGIDPSVSVLLVSQLDGTPLAIVENYAMHLDTIGGTSVSADFPHFLSAILGRVMGPQLLTVRDGCLRKHQRPLGHPQHRSPAELRPRPGGSALCWPARCSSHRVCRAAGSR